MSHSENLYLIFGLKNRSIGSNITLKYVVFYLPSIVSILSMLFQSLVIDLTKTYRRAIFKYFPSLSDAHMIFCYMFNVCIVILDITYGGMTRSHHNTSILHTLLSCQNIPLQNGTYFVCV